MSYFDLSLFIMVKMAFGLGLFAVAVVAGMVIGQLEFF